MCPLQRKMIDLEVHSRLSLPHSEAPEPAAAHASPFSLALLVMNPIRGLVWAS